ncbi:MAG: glycosyltransferase family 2 protein [Victivallaceae bacterium]|nr:glycosyltransferase family 2 protein [Victivallaceae bacterium]
MKLSIQIPCSNEEATLPQTVADIPRTIEGCDEVELLVIDDGSTDRTVETAKSLGIRHIVSHPRNQGLAEAFRTGISYALEHGADVVVNTDADNQYCGADIPLLVKTLVEEKADIVVGCRPIMQNREFSPIKKVLQLLGSWTLRKISKTTVRDAASGFRAFSREACLRIFIHSKFSYCMETLIQAGNSGMKVSSVDIRTNPKTRDSRLFTSIAQYIRKSGGTMLSMFVLYRPGTFFLVSSLPFWLISLLIGLRAMILKYCYGHGFREFLPSFFILLFSATVASLLCSMSLIGNLFRAQRRISEELLYMERSRKYNKR